MSALPRIRLLPVLIFLAVLMLSVRLGAVWNGVEQMRTLEVGHASALAQATPAAGGTPTPAPPAPAAGTPAAPAPAAGTPASSDPAASAPAPAADATPAPDPLGREAPSTFTQSELDLLQRLSERRQQLESQAHEMDQREAMLRAAEGRIDKKIAEMKTLEASIQALLKQRDAQEQARLDMLVNIYKAMKPKEAAVIFNDMEMPLIVDIFMLMKERSSAAILANMDPARAREVTQELARKRMPVDPAQGAPG
ncbi:MotE family protein [Pararhodospirillum oryzae]|uniref:Magnesium transporter MgtE intracellular domain-containing protein n=1 Tax=Pararhodospirillum oryzae TaxID=478448 RepID=A0A512H8M4_9PROT|nr:hypothetical protein [Pararhodospirillum oryzae]GEO81799.1 hypothetical protein ROR02_19300 [Pararhodospirillum oryzae]